jgi:hypothetical protein
MRLRFPAALILFPSLAVASLSGQSSTTPRTPTGQPDLQGVWTNNGVTPLQRPEALKDREFLTDAEVANLKRRAAELFESQQAGDLIGDRLFQEIIKDPALRPFDPDTGNYNSFWLVDRSVDNRTSLIVDPPNGRLPAARRIPKKSISTSAASHTVYRGWSLAITATSRSSRRPTMSRFFRR